MSLTACQRPKIPLATSYCTKDNPLFQVREGQFTFDEEGHEGGRYHTRTPSVPPSKSSGITLGKGYDMGNRSEKLIQLQLMKAGLTKNDAEEYAKTSGKKGGFQEEPYNTACRYLHENASKLIEITPQQQKDLFELIYPSYIERSIQETFKTDVVEKFGIVDWVRLDERVKALIVDLEYRGDFGRTAREWLFPSIINNNITALKAAFDKDEWKTLLRVPEERFNTRREYINGLQKLFKPDMISSVPQFAKLTYAIESQNSLLKPKFINADLGIVIGLGFSLRKRQCRRNNPNYSKVKTQNEIIGYLKAITGSDDTAQCFSCGITVNSRASFNEFVKNHPGLKLNSLQAKHLFELMSIQHQYEVIEICNREDVMEKYGVADWYKLDERIKDVLIDMSFTDHYDYPIIRKEIQQQCAANNIRAFISAIERLRVKKNEMAQMGVSVTNWEARFDARLCYLKAKQPQRRLSPKLSQHSQCRTACNESCASEKQ